MRTFLTLLFSLSTISLIGQKETDYPYLNNKTYTYEETCEIYKKLADKYQNAQLKEMGLSDAGKPIYLFAISADGDFDVASNKAKGKATLLINNAIHPGEPCGVDASVKLANDLLSNKKYTELIKTTVVYVIPFYNVGGGLNRSCCSRANQNGPEEYGFRGNTKNRDLNRDFIKCDTWNAKTFTKIYHTIDPDVFIDTHTTNGADFQYTMSLIATQPDKLQRYLRNYLRHGALPYIYADMKEKDKEIIPYVYMYKDAPDKGIMDYLETPRYSTGFTTLFNTLGFVTEALKYKPYKDRVEHTYAYLITTLNWMKDHQSKILLTRKQAIEAVMKQTTFELGWYHDTTSFRPIDFKGYELEEVPSAFGKDATKKVYNHDKPYTKKINYYNRYLSTYEVERPKAYVVPQAYDKVIERLQWNNIAMRQLTQDTVITAEVYYIKDYKTVKNPYEGHYLHYGVKVEKKTRTVKYNKGDYMVRVNQKGNRYIVETLEPQGMDSFFAWNFFDGILQQKEWYSSFSFEETALKLLEENKELNAEFENKRKTDKEFASSRSAQLYFIYLNSPYYEDTHNLYPVARIPLN